MLRQNSSFLVDLVTSSEELFREITKRYPEKIKKGQIWIDDSFHTDFGECWYWINGLNYKLLKPFLLNANDYAVYRRFSKKDKKTLIRKESSFCRG